MTTVQLAIFKECVPVVKYILGEHKVMNQQRQLKLVDPRLILINNYDPEDETLTLRLAIDR